MSYAVGSLAFLDPDQLQRDAVNLDLYPGDNSDGSVFESHRWFLGTVRHGRSSEPKAPH